MRIITLAVLRLAGNCRRAACVAAALSALILIAVSPAAAVNAPRGYRHGACDLDMNGDGVFGGIGDCDVCDGDLNADVDEIYVDCDNGDDLGGDGSAGNPYGTVGRAFAAADGPDVGEEDAVCIRGTCDAEVFPLIIPQDGKPTTFVRSRDLSQHEVRDFEYPDEPFGIYCWDSDNDDDYRSDETCVIDAGPVALEWCFKSGKSHFEMAHMTVMNCGAGQSSTADIGMGLFTSEVAKLSHHWWHHNTFAGINKDGIHNGKNRVFGYFQPDGGAIDWLAIENNYVPEFAGYFLRGGQGDGSHGFSDFWRIKNNTHTCHGCDQDAGLCAGQPDPKVKCSLSDVWGALNDVEILNNHSDANVLAWTQGAAVGWNAHSCTQGWDIVNNELIDFQDSILLEASDSSPQPTCPVLQRPIDDVRIADNLIVLRNDADWGGEHLFPLTIAPGREGGGEFETVKRAQIVNNTVRCENASKVGYVIALHAAHDSAVCPGGNEGGLIEVYNNTSNCDYSQTSRGGIWIGNRGTSGLARSCAQTGYRIRNNILVGYTDRDCVVVEAEWNSTKLDIDHQVYDPACTWRWKGTRYTSLAAWQGQAGVDDSESRTCTPSFVDAVEPDLDLHLDPSDTCAQGAAETLAATFGTDRDGDMRTYSSDIGSDEASVAPLDCATNADCDDTFFCSGPELCVDNICVGSEDPCFGTVCDETATACVGCFDADDCNDEDPCTTDSCTQGVCSNVSHTGACDDGLACTTADTCDAFGICAGVPVDCSAADDACVDGICDGSTGTCIGLPKLSGTVCSDGSACTTADACDDFGNCVGVPLDCSAFGDACNDGVCDPIDGACVQTPLPNGTVCDDGIYCNGVELCDAGACTAGLDPCPELFCDELSAACAGCLGDLDCDDFNPCTTDTCNAGKCESTPNGDTCDDGDPCTVSDICASGSCSGVTVDCSAAGDACNDGVCDGASGACVAQPKLDGTSCSDGAFCNGTERCFGGACLSDGDPCTGRSCDEASDACADCQVDGDCDDTDFCNGAETCVAGACVPGGDPCAGRLCDEAGDTCTDCLVDGDCADADFCNGAETCVAGACAPGGNPCTGRLCDEAGDACADCLIDGDCADADFCNGAETCVAGTCAPGADPCVGQLCDEAGDTCADCLVDGDCADAEVCTTESCVVGSCTTMPNTDPCDDGDPCTSGDTCDGSGSCVGSPIDCADSGDVCNDGVCDALSGSCIPLPKLDGASCADVDFCNGAEVCIVGVCTPGVDPCAGQLCDEAVDACVECFADSDCEDETFCNGTETCVSGACRAGAPPCGVQICDESVDLCVLSTDPDNDGLEGAADPCPSDPRNMCFGPVAVDRDTGNDIRVNANVSSAECSGQKVDCNGDLWNADFGYNQAGKAATCKLDGGGEGCVISGIPSLFGCDSEETEDLFQCEHSDREPSPELIYSFNVPNGLYLVNLFFANTDAGTAQVGGRLMHLLVEGQVAYASFDQVAAAGGSGIAVVRSVVANVNDGNGLQFEMINLPESAPAVKAIEVLEADELTPPTTLVPPTTLAPPTTLSPTTTTTTTTLIPPALSDFDNDGLSDTADPCPADARNACFGLPTIDGTTGHPIRINTNVSNRECSGIKAMCNGEVWMADFGYNQTQKGGACDLGGGGEACVITGISELFGCEDEETEDVFQCEHSDRNPAPSLFYDFDVPNGQYLVNLYFADTYSGTTEVGSRVFDIYVEEALEYGAFDVVSAAGSNARVVVRSVVADVLDDNGLSLHFEQVVENPAIKGIEVLAPF